MTLSTPQPRTPRLQELDVASLLQHTATIRSLSELSGVQTRTLHRWCHIGLTLVDADRLAVAVGAHPSEVWPYWFECVDAERRAKNAARKRRLRQRVKVRAAEKAYKTRQYQETADYVKAKQRAYYWANRDAVLERNRAYRQRVDRERLNATRRAWYHRTKKNAA